MYPLSLGALLRLPVQIPGLKPDSLQGDYALLQKIACFSPESLQMEKSPTALCLQPTTGSVGETTTTLLPFEGGEEELELDLDSSDTTLTFAVLAAFRRGPTVLANVDNQNVKECDRLNVAVDMLLQLGIPAFYCPTEKKLRIDPGAAHHNTAPTTVYINCKKDHRVAMSAAVLAAGLGRVRERVCTVKIDDYRCVDKTYPSFWDDVSLKFQILTAVEPEGGGAKPSSTFQLRTLDPPLPKRPLGARPIFFVGLPGAGKSSLSQAAAHHFGLKRVETDAECTRILNEKYPPPQQQQPAAGSATTHRTISEFVNADPANWPKFRAIERSVLLHLATQPHPILVDCGGGAVEQNRDVFALLKRHGGQIIHISRALPQIMQSLQQREGFFVKTSDDLDHLAAKRLPLYASLRTLWFENTSADLPASEARFASWMRFALDLPLEIRPYSLFMAVPSGPETADPAAAGEVPSTSLTTAENPPSQTTKMKKYRDLLFPRGPLDFLELRADLAADWKTMLQTLQQNDIFQVIFTLRSVAEGGRFSGTQDEKRMLYEQALARGVPLFDIEAFTDEFPLEAPGGNAVHDLYRSATTTSPHVAQKRNVILSVHSDDFPRMKMALLKKRLFYGVFCYKIVTSKSLAPLVEEFVAQELDRPCILIYRDDPHSRLKNPVLTPVCENQPVFPGQLSLSEVLQGRQVMKINERGGRMFFLLGSPVLKSAGPQWHNAWWRKLQRKQQVLPAAETRAFSPALLSCLCLSGPGGSVRDVDSRQAQIARIHSPWNFWFMACLQERCVPPSIREARSEVARQRLFHTFGSDGWVDGWKLRFRAAALLRSLARSTRSAITTFFKRRDWTTCVTY